MIGADPVAAKDTHPPDPLLVRVGGCSDWDSTGKRVGAVRLVRSAREVPSGR